MEELDLKELFGIFWSKKVEIVLITIMFVLIGAIYSYFLLTPEYTSSTTLVLTQSGESSTDSDSSITQTDITLNSKLVSTYSELIKSKSVLTEVIQNLGIEEITVNSIKNNIKVKSVSDTELIEISVSNKNPNYASAIANETAKVFSSKIGEIYNINNVYVVDKAEPTTNPSNVNHLKDLIIFAFIGIVVAIIYSLVYNMLDNTIKTEQDIEKATGLMVLASIPNYEVQNKKGGRRA